MKYIVPILGAVIVLNIAVNAHRYSQWGGVLREAASRDDALVSEISSLRGELATATKDNQALVARTNEELREAAKREGDLLTRVYQFELLDAERKRKPVIKYLVHPNGRRWVVEQWTTAPAWGHVIVGIFATKSGADIYAGQLEQSK